MSVTLEGRAARVREWLAPHRINGRWDARRALMSGVAVSVARDVAMLAGMGRRPGPRRAPAYYREGESWRRLAWWLRCHRIMLRMVPSGVAMRWHLYRVVIGKAVMHPGRECCAPGGEHAPPEGGGVK